MYLLWLLAKRSELQKKRIELQNGDYGIFTPLIIRQEYALSLPDDFSIFYLR